MGKVWDVKRPAKKPSSASLINELHERGVTIEQIFAQYYATEAAGDHNTLTVADAELAGF